MDKSTKQALLDKYSRREPSKFRQFDAWNDWHGDMLDGDGDGIVVTGPSPTYELMKGSVVRVLIKPGTPKEVAANLLLRIARYIERDGLESGGQEGEYEPSLERWYEDSMGNNPSTLISFTEDKTVRNLDTETSAAIKRITTNVASMREKDRAVVLEHFEKVAQAPQDWVRHEDELEFSVTTTNGYWRRPCRACGRMERGDDINVWTQHGPVYGLLCEMCAERLAPALQQAVKEARQQAIESAGGYSQEGDSPYWRSIEASATRLNAK